jgi:hypothetical protein
VSVANERLAEMMRGTNGPVAAACVLLIAAGMAHAQERFPNRPISI